MTRRASSTGPALAARLRPSRLGAALLPCLLLLGCGEAFTTGASSMRIEVEVYKGPLSKDPHSQWGELLGYIREADQALHAIGVAYASLALADDKVRIRLQDDPNTRGVNETVTQAESAKNEFMAAIENADLEAFANLVGYSGGNPRVADWRGACAGGYLENTSTWFWRAWGPRCGHLLGLFASYIQLRTGLRGLAADLCYALREPIEQQEPIDCPGGAPRNPNRKVVELLTEVAEISARADAKSFYWAATELNKVDLVAANDELTDSVVLFSNIANQISSRADRLLMQIAGTDRRHLPLSVYLRDVQPTDFMNLYDWYEGWPGLGDAVYGTRVIERLFADSHWANINTVYASGQGDTAMAFIKDDIGNWNLKAFENDPSELLEAYTELTLGAIEQAAKLAKTAGSSGGTAALDQALALASRASAGKIGGGEAASFDVTALHADVAADLEALAAAVKQERAALLQQAADARNAEKKALTDSELKKEEAEKSNLDVSDDELSQADGAVVSAHGSFHQAKFEIDKSDLSETEKAKASGHLTSSQQERDIAAQRLIDAKAAEAPESGDPEPEKAKALRRQAMQSAERAKLWAEAAQLALGHAEAVRKTASAEKAVADHHLTVRARLRDILNGHATVLDAVESMAVSQASTSPGLPQVGQ